MKNKSFDLGTIGALFIVCLFAVSMFMTLAYGSRSYSRISDVMERQYTVRTAAGYLCTRARQGNAEGMLAVDTLDGCQVMILREEDFGDVYLTYIYCHDGYLRELYCPAEEPFHASDGEIVVRADSAAFRLEDGLLRIECEAGGRRAVQFVRLVGGEGADA